MDRRTKIVVTLGPASEEPDMIKGLIMAGVNVFRLNFSHGSHAEHAKRIDDLRKVSADLGVPVTVLQDLQGPKIRTQTIRGGQVQINQGQTLTLTTRPVEGTAEIVSVDFPDLPNSVKPGGRILLDDGNLELVVVGVTDEQIETKVVQGGLLKPNKGVNLPGTKLNVPSITKKDEEDLAFGLHHSVDAVAMSFVRTADDVVRLRNTMQRMTGEQHNLPIIAKLERPEALENLAAILGVADGVMVARGDLGVEMPPESVPIAQKQIIDAANQKAKLVITATQMLESMINNPRPTRAEASDVANAIFDGSDAVMLSGETAVGKYPVQSVEMMDAIIQKAEAQFPNWGRWCGFLDDERMQESMRDSRVSEERQDDAISITRAARELAHDRNVAAIAVFTETGRTAQLMSKARPRVPILAFTPTQSTYRRLPMLWGVIPHLVPHVDTLEGMLKDVEEAIVKATPLQPGQQVVLISGFPVGTRRPPNVALLHTIGDIE